MEGKPPEGTQPQQTEKPKEKPPEKLATVTELVQPAGSAPAAAQGAEPPMTIKEKELHRQVLELQAQLAARDARPMGMAKAVPGAAFVLVENTSERMHAVNEGQPAGVKGVRVKKPYINLWPGLNKVETVQWERALKEPMVKLHLAGRTFVERAKLNAYSDLSETDAVALLENAYEQNLLKDWGGKDARPSVQDAIKKQWDKIHGERANPDKPAQRTTMKAFAARMAGNG